MKKEIYRKKICENSLRDILTYNINNFIAYSKYEKNVLNKIRYKEIQY